jgi:transcriptional regulator with XRE-family HTH domain
MSNIDRARSLLTAQPMTINDLARKLGVSQQRASEIKKALPGLNVVGHVKREGRYGREPAIYSFDPPERGEYAHIGRVNSVFALGAA